MGSRDHSCEMCGRGGMSEPPCGDCERLREQLTEQARIWGNQVATLRAQLEEARGAIRSALAYLPNDAELAEMTDRDVRRALDGVWKPLHRALLPTKPEPVERVECDECGTVISPNVPSRAVGYLCGSPGCFGHYRKVSP